MQGCYYDIVLKSVSHAIIIIIITLHRRQCHVIIQSCVKKNTCPSGSSYEFVTVIKSFPLTIYSCLDMPGA